MDAELAFCWFLFSPVAKFKQGNIYTFRFCSQKSIYISIKMLIEFLQGTAKWQGREDVSGINL
jgi:hypothetical protein